MNNDKKLQICPVERAGGLDNSFRKIFQNPYKILKPYVSKGMTVLDLGCGPGFFSVEIAKLVTNSGKVIAADLQEGMLEKLTKKIKGTELEKIIQTHKCQSNSIAISEKVDFILAFYVMHEIPNHDNLFRELNSILNHQGLLYIIEPKFHVSKINFNKMIDKILNFGFEIKSHPVVFFSRAVLLAKKSEI